MADQFVWTCPGCRRTVPNRLALCRCGHTRTSEAAEPVAERPPGLAAPTSRKTRVNPIYIAFAAGMSVAIAAVVTGVLLLSASSPSGRDRPTSPREADAAAAVVPDPLGASAGEPLESSTRPLNPLTIEEIVTRTMPAVVTVETRRGHGSGFFVSPDTLLTNAHVVHDYSTVVLRPSGGSPVFARVVTSARDVDLAILRLDRPAARQVWLPLGSPADVQLGAEVIAIGSPLGLQNTVTRGIVSGMRTVKNVDVVQTDAAINPGNSGGPLIDRYGRVIGVTTLKLGGSAEAIGFAVSVRYARTLLNRPR
jgi:S1-C subfamily serine protease